MKNNITILLIKAVFALPLFVFGAWLIQMLYFPEVKAGIPEAALREAEADIMFRTEQQELAPIPRGHFHMVDATVFQSSPFEPICRTCHGTYAHSKEKKVRSLLNSHEGFLACTVCHVRKAPADKTFSFTWVDQQTGMTTMKVAGEYGKFPAKIFLKKVDARGKETIIQPISATSAEAFLKQREKLTAEMVTQAKDKLHENISKKPVVCIECHKRGGYLDFAELGFAGYRVEHLTSLEIARMIEKYETFYLPGVIEFATQ